METSFLPKTNEIIVRISAHYTFGSFAILSPDLVIALHFFSICTTDHNKLVTQTQATFSLTFKLKNIFTIFPSFLWKNSSSFKSSYAQLRREEFQQYQLADESVLFELMNNKARHEIRIVNPARWP